MRGTIFRGDDGWGDDGPDRAVREPPLRSVREVGMDSLRCGKTDGGEGIREADEIPRE